MFFPLRDDNPTRGIAWLTYALIAVNVAVHVAVTRELALGKFWSVAWYGLVPSRLLFDPVGESGTIFSSMFMHGDWVHLGSNMWFLHIFGDNLEQALGRLRYLAFYLACGVLAAIAQVAVSPFSQIPMVGASGAIAGVIGGYMLLHPRVPILTLNTIPLLWFFLGVFVVLPAWVIAGLFFVQNLGMAVLSNVASALAPTQGAVAPSIAFVAHVGGFAAGMALVKPLLRGDRPPSHVWQGFRPSRRVDPRSRRW